MSRFDEHSATPSVSHVGASEVYRTTAAIEKHRATSSTNSSFTPGPLITQLINVPGVKPLMDPRTYEARAESEGYSNVQAASAITPTSATRTATAAQAVAGSRR